MSKHVCRRFFTIGLLKPLQRTEEELQQTVMTFMGEMEARTTPMQDGVLPNSS